MAIFQMEQEMNAMTDLFTRLQKACWHKCIPGRYVEGTLNKGESVCIDRCTIKYLGAHDEIGKKMMAHMQTVAEEQAAAMAAAQQ